MKKEQAKAELLDKIEQIKDAGINPIGAIASFFLAEDKIIFATEKDANTIHNQFGKELEAGYITKEEGERYIDYHKTKGKEEDLVVIWL